MSVLHRFYCIANKSVPHAFDNHISTGTNPCINVVIHMLLTHRFDTLNILNVILVNSLPTSVICSYPLQTNKLDSDQARQNVGPDLDLICLTLRWYS